MIKKKIVSRNMARQLQDEFQTEEISTRALSMGNTKVKDSREEGKCRRMCGLSN